MTSVVGPDVPRCQTGVAAQPTTVVADGGTIAVSVTAARDCTWSASSESPWMQLSATSGQGDGSISVAVAPNELPSVRSGAVVVNDQRLTVSQEGRPCTFDLRGTSLLSSTGGRGSIEVATADGCTWNVATSASWIRLITTSGRGPGVAEFEASPNPGPAREAIVTVGTEQRTITQAAAGDTPPVIPVPPSCAPSVSPVAVNVPFGGGPATVTLTIGPACDWSADAGESWVTVSPQQGRGNSPVTLSAAANTGPARSTTVTIAQQTVTVSQPAGPVEPACTYTVSPAARDVGAGSGNNTFSIGTSNGCAWSASDNANWITVSQTTGNGARNVGYTFQANPTTEPRVGRITVQGQTHTVRQAAGTPPPTPACTFQLDSGSNDFPAAGGKATVRVTAAPQGCAGTWSVTGAPEWVQVTGGSGSASGEFSYAVAPNGGTDTRRVTLTVGSRSHQITQAGTPAPTPTCTFQIDSAGNDFPAAGGNATVRVTATPPGCAGTWSVAGAPDWVQVTRGSGSASGEFSYTVAPNGGTDTRRVTLNVGGRSHQITQAGTPAPTPTCTFQIDSAGNNFPAAGGNATVRVTATPPGCAGTWSVVGAPDWVQVTPGSGSASGEFSYTVAPNGGTDTRRVTLTVGSQPHLITQAGTPPPTPTCTFQIDSAGNNFPATGGNGTVSVTATPPGCAGTWSVAGAPDWVQVNNGSGSASGVFTYTVAPNGGTDTRTVTLTVGDRPHLITQAGTPAPTPACTFQIDPAGNTFPATGGNGTVSVTATPPGCAGTWSVAGAPDWVQVSGGSGSASAVFTYTVAPNGGTGPRNATLTVGGRLHEITQAGTPAPPPPPPCTYAINPTELNADSDGAFGFVEVETGPTCAWTVSGGADWVRIVGDGTTGSGRVGYFVAPNRTGASRETTVTIAGRPFRVIQR